MKILIATLIFALALTSTCVPLATAAPLKSPQPVKVSKPKPTDHMSRERRDKNLVKIRQHADKHFEKSKRNAQRHWNGHRFDDRFFARNFGRYHTFFFGAPGFYWYGNPCLFGSTFEFGGAYFALNTPCDQMWVGYPWMAQVYIDESLDGEGYVLVNPDFPGVTFGIKVVF